MAAGDYGVDFSATGYERVRQDVRIERRQRTTVTVALASSSGTCACDRTSRAAGDSELV